MHVSRRHLIVLAATSPALAAPRTARRPRAENAPDPRMRELADGVVLHTLWAQRDGIWRASNFVVANAEASVTLLAPCPRWPLTGNPKGWWMAALPEPPALGGALPRGLAPLAPEAEIPAGAGAIRLEPDARLRLSVAGADWLIPRAGLPTRSRA